MNSAGLQTSFFRALAAAPKPRSATSVAGSDSKLSCWRKMVVCCQIEFDDGRVAMPFFWSTHTHTPRTRVRPEPRCAGCEAKRTPSRVGDSQHPPEGTLSNPPEPSHARHEVIPCTWLCAIVVTSKCSVQSVRPLTRL